MFGKCFYIFASALESSKFAFAQLSTKFCHLAYSYGNQNSRFAHLVTVLDEIAQQTEGEFPDDISVPGQPTIIKADTETTVNYLNIPY